MRWAGDLRASIAGIGLALVLMLVCLSWPSPRTIGIFLGAGLPVAIVSVLVFALYVVRDLHARRAL